MLRTPSRSRGIALLCVLAATGCTGSGAPAASPTPTPTASQYTVVREAVDRPSDGLPAAVGTPVVTMTGLIDEPGIVLDLEGLERLGVVAYDMDDPQAEGRVARFEGVLLSVLLDAAGASPDATRLHVTALNDYAVDIPLDDVQSMPVMLATAVDGERMSVERFGPTRVVYPMQQLALPRSTYDARLIWQVASIDVR